MSQSVILDAILAGIFLAFSMLGFSLAAQSRNWLRSFLRF
jgi:hypothetical protein